MSLPSAPRIASPSFDRSVGFDVLGVGLAGFALTVVVPGVGGYLLVPAIVLAFVIAARRRTIGAYEGEHALVVRGFTRTVEIPWSAADGVITVRDPWFPWQRVVAIKRANADRVVVTALRYSGEPPAPVLTLTRIVRDRRELRSRETWDP